MHDNWHSFTLTKTIEHMMRGRVAMIMELAMGTNALNRCSGHLKTTLNHQILAMKIN